jgi:hypothetical protein
MYQLEFKHAFVKFFPPLATKHAYSQQPRSPLFRERSIDRRTTDPQRRAGTVLAFIVADVVCVSEGLFR